MKVERLILKNTVVLAAGKGLGDVCSFFFLVYFARFFGTDMLGKYAFAMSVGGLLTVAINLGLNTLMIREVSKDKSQNLKFTGNLLITKALLSFLIWLLIGLFAFLSNFSNDTKLVLILIGSYHIFYQFTMLFRAAFRAHEEMQYSALLEIYHKALILIFGIISIIIWENPIITLAVYPASAFSMFILGFILFVWRYGWPDLKVDFAFMKSLLIQGIPFLMIILLAQFYDRIGVILLTYLKGATAAGIFSASDRFLTVITAGLAIFSSALFPAMAKFSVDRRDKLFKLYERSFRIMIVCVLPLSIILFVLSKQIILLAFGKQFIESVQVLQVISWALLFIGLNYILSVFLMVTDHQRYLVKIRAIVYIGYFIVSAGLIWKYSYAGLAYARVITEAILFIATFSYAYKVIFAFRVIKILLVTVSSCLLSILLCLIIPDLEVWIIAPSCLAVYILVMFILKGIRLHDFVFLKNILLGNENV